MVREETFYVSYPGNIRPSIAHAHDTNHIHNSPSHTRIAYGALNSKGKTKEDIANLNADMPFPFVMAPGALIISYIDHSRVIPNAKGISSLRCTFKLPLLVFQERFAQLTTEIDDEQDPTRSIVRFKGNYFLDESDKKRKSVELGYSKIGIAGKDFNFNEAYGNKLRVQRNEAICLRDSLLYDDVEHKGKLHRKAYMYRQKPLAFTRTFLPRVSKEDHLHYVMSIEMDKRAADPVVTPLEVVTKIPRHQLLFIDELMQQNEFLDDIKHIFSPDSDPREKAAWEYVQKYNKRPEQSFGEHSLEKVVEDILTAPLVLFRTLECFYDPTIEMKIGKEFELLFHYAGPGIGQTYKFIAEGFLDGRRFVYVNILLAFEQLFTEPVISYHIDTLEKSIADNKIPLHVLARRARVQQPLEKVQAS